MQLLITTINAKYIHTNLAVRWLYLLNREKANIDWREFTLKENQDEIAAFCSQYEVVAFSCYIWNITATLAVAEKIKIINPNTIILLGGPEVSYEYDAIIRLPQIDFIITGEGEIPFAAFIENYPAVDAVPSLVYIAENTIVSNPPSPLYDLKNFEKINPYITDVVDSLSSKVLYVETSRGCPYKCEFCLASLDNKVRYLPMETTKDTLLYLMQHGKVIKFLDRTFNARKNFTLEIFNFILENYKEGNVFQFEITADILLPEIIDFINEKVPKGLFRFEIGIQTVNQTANLAVSRKQNFEKTKSIILALQDKVEMHLDLIVGLPHDFWADIKYSFEEVFSLFAPELQLGFLKFLKGTPVREKYEMYEYEFDPLPPYQIIRSKFLSAEELHQILLLENALEIYWNKKRCIRSLKYIAIKYSIFDFLLKLGELFDGKIGNAQYGLNDIYTIIMELAVTDFADDKILRELIAIDYYTQYKVKPKPLFEAELAAKERNQFILANQLNHHLYRFAILPVSFDLIHFDISLKIKKEEKFIAIQYDGNETPIVVSYPFVTN